jgi:hypothetical protein
VGFGVEVEVATLVKVLEDSVGNTWVGTGSGAKNEQVVKKSNNRNEFEREKALSIV